MDLQLKKITIFNDEDGNEYEAYQLTPDQLVEMLDLHSRHVLNVVKMQTQANYKPIFDNMFLESITKDK